MAENFEQISPDALKCDKEGCDYVVEVPFAEYTDWINRPCPKCGSNLLTYGDYERAKTVREMLEFMNTLSPEELETLAKSAEGEIDPALKEKIDEIYKQDPNAITKVSVSTHNKIEITDIKKLNP